MAVSTVLQCSRNQYCRRKKLLHIVFAHKAHCVFKGVLVVSAILQHCNTATLAKDFAIHGVIYAIEEKDPIQLIQQKLKTMEENGELERHNQELQRKTSTSIERPKPITEITKAPESRVFYYDPTYVAKEDMKDHQGLVIHKKGKRINPLETVNLSQNLIFFDGDDVDQKNWTLEKLKEKTSKLILVKGAPLALAEELKIPVYFDQGGVLTNKLHIHHVPALVTQDGLRLRIEEIQLKENGQSKSHRDL